MSESSASVLPSRRRGLDPPGVVRHPELTVTVAEVDRLAELLGTGVATEPRPTRV